MLAGEPLLLLLVRGMHLGDILIRHQLFLVHFLGRHFVHLLKVCFITFDGLKANANRHGIKTTKLSRLFTG